ncbi:MAG: ATP-binding cassette domain-containing protein [Deltaproteobacteria bacterium]|nr:ATP-binding cassette domain-containing protein [Deltaproteobacteria bacterium]
MIECKQVDFRYRRSQKKILSQFSFHFEEAKHYYIKGEHGAGKSTLMKLLASQQFSFVEGEMQGDILHFIPQPRILFFDARDVELFFYEKIYDEFYYILRCVGYPRNNIETQIALIMSYFQIESWSHRLVSDLSMGEKQYLKLILAIATKQYQLMCLDEPFLHLDDVHKHFILQYLEQISQDFDTSLIVIDHQIQAWEQYFHFETIELTTQDAYQPWFTLPENYQINSFPEQKVDFIKAPLPAIQEQCITLKPGQINMIVGKNGSGKTTMCKYLMDMFVPANIAISCKRMLMADAKTMYFYTTLGEEWTDVDGIDLHPYATFYSQHLSYGQCKVEMFQRLLADGPQLLILDDLFDGLHDSYRSGAYRMIQELKNKGSMIILTGTQDLDMEGIDEVISI